jgi:glycerol-3-phosphate dehydrogenase
LKKNEKTKKEAKMNNKITELKNYLVEKDLNETLQQKEELLFNSRESAVRFFYKMIKKHNSKENQQILITKGSRKSNYIVPGRPIITIGSNVKNQ